MHERAFHVKPAAMTTPVLRGSGPEGGRPYHPPGSRARMTKTKRTSSRARGTADPHGEAEPKYHERGLLRGLQVLTAFSVERPEHDLGSLSEALDLAKPTLVRLLDCLKFAGFVDVDPRSGTYRLGLRAFEVGAVYQQTATLDRVGRPVLAALAQSTGQSTNLAVLDRGQVVHVSLVQSPRPIRYEGYVGLREDAYCTGLGKVLLAALPADELDAYLRQVVFRPRTPNTIANPTALRRALAEVARRGYALDDEEVSIGLRCVAVPVRSAVGATVAAVSASGPKAEFEGKQLKEIVAAVTRAADDVRDRLGSAAGAANGRLLSPAWSGIAPHETLVRRA